MNPLLLTDFYKVHHNKMYPENTTLIYSNLTPRKSRIQGVDKVVVFGIQHFIKEYLIDKFNREFFGQPKAVVLVEYKKHIPVDVGHIGALHDLGYLPIEIKALPEGLQCPIGVPLLTIKNTHPEFAWLTNYIETLMSSMLWQPITSATIANEYKKLLTKYALETTGDASFVQWQGHDFSFRGMSSVESAILSGMGHMLSFTGTDTIPAIYQLEKSYNADGLIGASVPATEHSVMCMGIKENETETFKRLLKLYPTGILSVVSDTWDLWKVINEILPQIKNEILSRDGKLVIRPDSGDPVDILCGKDIKSYKTLQEAKDQFSEELNESQIHGKPYFSISETRVIEVNSEYFHLGADVEWNRHDKTYYFTERIEIQETKISMKPSEKGVIELLWDLFGGTINKYGYKELDSHIGVIYGDSITLDRAGEICERLKQKGFASTNTVLGIGSYTYQYNTRDTFGFAVKATYGEVKCHSLDNGNPTIVNDHGQVVEIREIFKDPITDDGTKKSKKGLLMVYKSDNGLKVRDQQTWEQESQGELQIVFKDGKLIKETTLEETRTRLNNAN